MTQPNNPTTRETLQRIAATGPLGESVMRYTDRCLVAASPYGIGNEGGQIPLYDEQGRLRGPEAFLEESKRRLVEGSPPANVQRDGIDDDLGRPLTRTEQEARARRDEIRTAAPRAGRLPIDAPPPRVVVARYALEEQIPLDLHPEVLRRAAEAVVKALDEYDRTHP